MGLISRVSSRTYRKKTFMAFNSFLNGEITPNSFISNKTVVQQNTTANPVFNEFLNNATQTGTEPETGFNLFGSVLKFFNLENIEDTSKKVIEYAVLWSFLLSIMIKAAN